MGIYHKSPREIIIQESEKLINKAISDGKTPYFMKIVEDLLHHSEEKNKHNVFPCEVATAIMHSKYADIFIAMENMQFGQFEYAQVCIKPTWKSK